jgi:hypothetical protein
VGGGVLIAVPVLFDCFKLSKLCISNNEFDSLCLRIQPKGRNSPLTHLAVIYKRPNNEFSLGYCNLIEKLCSLENIILTGDFNTPINWPSFPVINNVPSRTKPFIDTLINSGLTQFVDAPSRAQNYLDLVFSFPHIVSDCVVTENSFSENSHFSDHNIIKLRISTFNNLNPSIRKTIQDLNRADISGIIDAYRLFPWDDVFDACANSADAYSLLLTQFTRVLDNFVPSIQVTGGKPLHSSKCNGLFHLTERLKSKYLADKLSLQKKYAFLIVEKSLISLIKKEEIEFENRSIKNQNKSSFWKFINNRLGNNNSVWPASDLSGNCLNSTAEIATAFSEFFSSVFNRSQLSAPEIEDIVGDFNPNITSEFRLFPLTPISLASYFRLLPNKTSVGINGLSNKFIKLIGSIFAVPLSKLFNFVLFTASIPSDWRISYVTPVPKDQKAASLSDYRPISVTCADSKLFELILKDIILGHLNANNIIPSQQFGFLPGRCTSGNLLSYLNKVTDFVQNNISVDVIYLDFSKAFDKVIHSILLAKLQKLGFSGHFVNLIESWLVNRIQIVKVDNSLSGAKQVYSGVPQGTVLGPILFNIYISDLFLLFNDATIYGYADDSKLLMPIRDPADCAKLQLELQCLHRWCHRNGMSVNLSKTSVMHFGKTNPRHCYFFGDVPLSVTKLTRDLGVMIDDQLKFTEHVAHVAHKANMRVALIRNSFRHRAPDFHLKLFKIFVLPIIDDCSCVSMVSTVKDLETLENIQRIFTRNNIFYSGNYNDRPNYEIRLADLGLISISRRRRLLDILSLVKFINGRLYLTGFNWKFSKSTRGNDRKIFKPIASHCRAKFWFDRTINDYNSLPALNINSCSLELLNSIVPD